MRIHLCLSVSDLTELIRSEIVRDVILVAFQKIQHRRIFLVDVGELKLFGAYEAGLLRVLTFS